MSTENEDTSFRLDSNVISHRAGPKNNTRYRNLFQGYDIHVNDVAVDQDTRRDRTELEHRQKDVAELGERRDQARKRCTECKESVKAFEQLLAETKAAGNLRNPTADQLASIDRLQTTVSTINLENSDQMTEEERRQNQAAQHILTLNQSVEEAQKAWDKATKEYEDNNKFINQLKDRLSKGRTHEVAVYGNHVNYIPTREHMSMYVDTTNAMRQVWALLDGDNLLKLRFGTLKNGLTNLRRSVNEDLMRMSSGDFLNRDF